MPNKNAVYQRSCKSRCRKYEVDLLKQKIESQGEVNDGPSTQKEISVSHEMGSFYRCICVREDKGFKLHVAKMFRSKKMKPSRRWDMEELVKKIWIFVKIFGTNWLLRQQNMLPRQLLQEFSIWVHQNTQNYQQILFSINLIIFGTKETRSADVQDKTSGANVHQQSCRRQDERVITCDKVLTKLTNSVNRRQLTRQGRSKCSVCFDEIVDTFYKEHH